MGEPHSAFPFSMDLLLGALMAVLIPESTNALCCQYKPSGGYALEGVLTGIGLGKGSCSSHIGHTCNIFCCNCGGGRPGTSKCLPGTGRKRRSVHGYGVAPWETVQEMDEEMDEYY